MLSKSKYTRGLNCQKSLWLYVHKKQEQVISESTRATFARGTNAGELAQQYFPNGKMAVLEEYPGYESAKRTQQFIEQGVDTIYEATFIFDNTLVAVDILHKQNGKWSLYEVKGTNGVKSVHIPDVAVQYYVVKGSGIDLEDAYLMHFNREYVRRGAIDVNKLFLPESVLEQVLPLQEEIEANITSFLAMIEGEEPVVEMGGHCTNPYECAFYEYCSALLPESSEPAVKLSSDPQVKKAELESFIDNIVYPICHLDFETIMPGIPLFDESRPYQQIPFQYSIHTQESKNGKLEHYFYLAPSNLNIDPRKALIEQMIKDTKGAKTIFVYYIAFERTRIEEMCRDFPEYSKELGSIIFRLKDLIIPFKQKLYRTETMNGSSSIKKVLPALCPDLSYDNLEIGEGMAASYAFLDLYSCTDQEQIAHTRENLLQYCHLDTYAMVKILDVLQKA